MIVGWHHLDDSCPDVLPAATFLDVAGSGVGMKSPERLCRVYFKGRPDPREVATKARAWAVQGCRVQIANEPNLPMEGFGGGPDDFAAWFEDVARLAPTARLYWPGMSPIDGFEAWYSGRCKDVIKEYASGIVVHAYGTSRQFLRGLGVAVSAETAKPLWVGECNPGAGNTFDRDAWARDELPKILGYAQAAGCEAFTYFAYRWPTPDMSLPTPVDGAGTEIERVLREWKPDTKPTPKEPPKMLRFVDISNYQGIVDMSGWKSAGIDGAIVRVSEDGSPLDAFAPANVKQLRAGGFLVGLYHLTDPRFASPVKSLERFQEGIDNVGGLLPGEVPFNDAEQGDPGDHAPFQAQWGREFANTHGFKAGFYSAPWWMDPHNLSHEGVAREYSCLWEAKFTGDPNTKPDDLPGWFEVMVQYTASGQVPGVNGNVDLNTFYGSREDWLKLGKPGVVEQPKPNRVAAALARLRAATDELEQAIKEAA